ncbi:RRM domain-containing protein [Heracleum sosnowskyi]|uniref:RRM domain-containing protein n=1 Tax=Heracleum sosnowskyi TaxID=360622 RepID=A0AAD8IYY2_9APIA|nr:RRM domain-containing protein [Heracleum sosnowskyi]
MQVAIKLSHDLIELKMLRMESLILELREFDAELDPLIFCFCNVQVGGRTVKVNFPEVPRGGEREVMGPKIRSSYQSFVDSPHKLYAGNLSWSVTSQQLKEFFADQPGLLSAKVIYDRQSGRSQGYGFITFESAESVEAMT